MFIPYWRLSSFYFLYFATLGSFVPYWSLYLKDRGFNPVEIGELTALIVATKIISPNLWGWIADHTGKSLRIIRLASFFSVLFFSSFLYANGYFWFAWITIAFSFFWNASMPQFEAVTLHHLKTEYHRYSHIRVWGSIGFIAAVLGIGRLLDYQAITVLPKVIIGIMITIWLVSLITPDARLAPHETERISIMQILKKTEVLAFFTIYMLLQVSYAPYYVFYSVYLQHYSYTATIIGLLWALGVIAEILLFIFLVRIQKQLSIRSILLCSFTLAIVRWLLIARYAHYLPILIIAQILNAATFGGTHVAAINLLQKYFGKQHQGKGQALYTSTSFGLGGTIGSLYSGYFWEKMGYEFVYLMAAICCTIALLIAYLWVGKEK